MISKVEMAEFRDLLEEKKSILVKRLENINEDRTRKKGPLSQD